MEKDVLEAIQDNEEQIEELKTQIELIKSIDFTNPVDEDTWHKICETPLRTSKLLAVLVKNIFPDAEDILVHCNYVYFNLLGFKVQIPTSWSRGINVDMSWYSKDNGEPTLNLSSAQKIMQHYFQELDNGASWWTLANIRLNYRKWFIPFAWWFRYRWKDPNRELFEKILSEKEQDLEIRKKHYHQKRDEMHKKLLNFKMNFFR